MPERSRQSPEQELARARARLLVAAEAIQRSFPKRQVVLGASAAAFVAGFLMVRSPAFRERSARLLTRGFSLLLESRGRRGFGGP